VLVTVAVCIGRNRGVGNCLSPVVKGRAHRPVADFLQQILAYNPVTSTKDPDACRGYNPFMRNEFTAIIEQDEGWFIAYSPEVPGANGQGRTKDQAMQSLAQAIELILLDRRG
jgi:hypothetical protein